MNSTTLDLSAEFAGRRAVVTGGSRGIGAAIAQRLLAGGAEVVVTARTPAAATPPKATFIASDLRTQAAARTSPRRHSASSAPDILVNNARAARPHLAGGS